MASDVDFEKAKQARATDRRRCWHLRSWRTLLHRRSAGFVQGDEESGPVTSDELAARTNSASATFASG